MPKKKGKPKPKQPNPLVKQPNALGAPTMKNGKVVFPPGYGMGPAYGDQPIGGLAAFANQAARPAAGSLLNQFLSNQAAQQFYAGRAGAGAGGGGYSSGGGGAVANPYAAAGNAARSEITAAQAQWDARNAQLRNEQQAGGAATLAGLQTQSAQQLDAYKRAINPVQNDLKLQGFSAAPVQQQAALDEQRLAGDQQRNATLSQRFSEVADRSFADRTAAAAGHTAASQMSLAQQLALMAAEASSGGGGGGGGYGGGGG